MSGYAKNMRCPKCKHKGSFHFSAGCEVNVSVGENGEDVEGHTADVFWDDSSVVTCPNCGYRTEFPEFNYLTREQDLEMHRLLAPMVRGNLQFVFELIKLAGRKLSPDELHDLTLYLNSKISCTQSCRFCGSKANEHYCSRDTCPYSSSNRVV
jgi:hypothetical protein